MVSGCRAPRGRRSVGQRDVDRLLHEHPLVALGLQLDLAVLKRLPDRRAGHAHPLAGLGLGRRGQRTDLAVGQRQRRAVAGVREADGLQGVEVGGAGDRGEGSGLRRGDRVIGQRAHLDRVVGLVGGGHGLFRGSSRLAGNRGRFYRGRRAWRARPIPTPGQPPMRRCARAAAYRHTAAAVARLRLSARPRIGIRRRGRQPPGPRRAGHAPRCRSTQAMRSGEQPLALGGEQVGRVRRDVGGQDPEAGVPQGGNRLEGLPRVDDRQVEQRAGGGPHALGVRRVDAARRQGHTDGPGRVGHADQRRRRCPGRTSRGRAPAGRGRGSRSTSAERTTAPSDRPQRLPAGVCARPARRTPPHRPRAAATPEASQAAITSSRRSTQPSSTNTSTGHPAARASRTACGPSARNSPRARRNLATVSARASRTRADRALSTGSSADTRHSMSGPRRTPAARA